MVIASQNQAPMAWFFFFFAQTSPPSHLTQSRLPHWRGLEDLSKEGKHVYSDSSIGVETGGNVYLDMVCSYRVRDG
jgi:hypothetical protein